MDQPSNENKKTKSKKWGLLVINTAKAISIFIAGAVITPLIERYVEGYGKHKVKVAGYVYYLDGKKKEPVQLAIVKLLGKDFDERTDKKGYFSGWLTGVDKDTMTIEITLPDKKWDALKVPINFLKEQNNLDTFFFNNEDFSQILALPEKVTNKATDKINNNRNITSLYDSLTGIVVDSEQRALKGATVSIVGDLERTLTNEDGKFNLRIKKTSLLTDLKIRAEINGYVAKERIILNKYNIRLDLEKEKQ